MTEFDRILRLKAVLHKTGLSRSTIYRKVADGTFPPQIKISTHCTGWRESEINVWMSNPAFYGQGQYNIAGLKS